MTVHHWPDVRRGLSELRRVARGQAVFTWHPVHRPELWLLEEYLPEIRELEYARFTAMSEVAEALDAHTMLPFPIPHDFTDGCQIAHCLAAPSCQPARQGKRGLRVPPAHRRGELRPQVTAPSRDPLAYMPCKPAGDYSVPVSSVSLATSLEPEKHRR
ncbi:hypothetical protein [Streptomyces sp. NPDC048473]|uniref:hypothetical protein n=1 Tax=unclassified Streptomyces TaxID=2593676 RepID=UPI00371A22B5